MADGEIVIRIVSGSDQGGSTVSQDQTESVTTEVNAGSSSSNTLATAAYVTMIQRAGNSLKGTIVGEAKYQIAMYFRVNDAYLENQNMNIALGIIGKSSSMISTIGGFALAGSAAGPIGTIAGAALGTIVAGVNTGLEVAHNYKQEQLNIRIANTRLEFQRERAGYSLTAGSVGENR